jgi:hypothetical protein
MEEIEIIVVDGAIRLYGTDYDAVLSDQNSVLSVNRLARLECLARTVFSIGVQIGRNQARAVPIIGRVD